MACTAIHGIFDVTDQFKQAFSKGKNQTTVEKFLKLPTDVAYIKHIRWFGPPNGTAISCKFGADAEYWDPDYSLIVQVFPFSPLSSSDFFRVCCKRQ